MTMNDEDVKKDHATRNVVLVVMIVVSIIGGVAYLSYATTIYGCFGCGGAAQISASPLSCTATNATCRIALTNTGTMDTSAESCYFSVGGQGSLAATPGGRGSTVALPAGQTTYAYCTSAVGPSSGTQAAGTIDLTNGAAVPFSSTWG